jgi:hypothetical protein
MESRGRANENSESAAGLRRQLQTPAVALAQTLELADDGADSRATQRLARRQQGVLGVVAACDGELPNVDAQLQRRRRIKAMLRIGNEQQSIVTASAFRQCQSQRPRAGPFGAGQQLDEHAAGEPWE